MWYTWEPSTSKFSDSLPRTPAFHANMPTEKWYSFSGDLGLEVVHENYSHAHALCHSPTSESRILS